MSIKFQELMIRRILRNQEVIMGAMKILLFNQGGTLTGMYAEELTKQMNYTKEMWKEEHDPPQQYRR